jgi:site-specific recombinase XerD
VKGDWALELGDEVPITSDRQAYTILPLVPAPSAIVELIECPALPVEGRQSLRLLYASGIRASELEGASPVPSQPGLLALADGRLVPTTAAISAPVSVAQLEEWTLLAATHTGLLARYQGCSRRPCPTLFRHAYAVHCLEKGMDLFALSRVLDHQALLTTEMYLAAAMADCLDSYRRCHPFASGRTATADISLDEVLMLLDAPSNKLQKLGLRTLYATALRESELINLVPADLDPAGQRIFVRQGKGPKDRYTLLDSTTMELLTQLPNGPGDLIFPWTRGWVWQIVGKAAKKTGLDRKYPHLRISPHTLRHAYATHCYRNGMGLTVLAKLLGHPLITDTILYIHSSWDKLLADFGATNDS